VIRTNVINTLLEQQLHHNISAEQTEKLKNLFSVAEKLIFEPSRHRFELRQILESVFLLHLLTRAVSKSVPGSASHQLDQSFESVVDVFGRFLARPGLVLEVVVNVSAETVRVRRLVIADSMIVGGSVLEKIFVLKTKNQMILN